MILSRLMLNPRSREAMRDLADCQELHRTILSAFSQSPQSAPRGNFGILFRVEYSEGRGPEVLVQSKEMPQWRSLPASYICSPAESKDISHAWDAIAEGAVFGFRLRANPTRKIETKSGADGTTRNGKRVELRTEQQQIIWLTRKGANGGFEIVYVRTATEVPDVRVSDEGKTRGFRSPAGGTDGKHRLTFASVLFEGRLRVTEAEKFRATLAHGLGSAKAYGFGLLSIAPAG